MTFVKSSDGQLNYYKTGQGSKILLAFHGFGQDKKIFHKWGKNLNDHYTIYAFDVFYHGGSYRKYGPLSKAEWTAYLTAFLEKEKIHRFGVLGYSLGGRFAIASALSFPDHISEITLIAPDGVYATPWFRLATSPATRWLFKYYMLNPEKLDKLMKFNEQYKIVSPYLNDFVRKELGNAENRKRVYISWNHFKSLGYSKKELYEHFQCHPAKKRLILGNKDHIIKPEKIIPIIEKMGAFEIEILPLKHHQLIKPEVAKLLLNKTEK